MYSFCYELLDQVIARKCISMSRYSDDDESDSAETLENKNALPHIATDIDTNHSPGVNGSVVVDNSHAGKKSPNTDNEESLNAKKVSSIPIRNNNMGNENPIVGRDSASLGEDSQIMGNLDTKDTVISNRDYDSADGVAEHSKTDGFETSDVEQATTSSSRQALLSPDSST